MSYSPYKFDKAVLQSVIDKVFPKLREVMDAHKASHVALIGSSGISLMGLLTLNDFKVVQVRKPGEDSHGGELEGDFGYRLAPRCVFLDDFVTTGDTLRHVQKMLSSYNGSVEAVVGCKNTNYAADSGYVWTQNSVSVSTETGSIRLPYWIHEYDARFAK